MNNHHPLPQSLKILLVFLLLSLPTFGLAGLCYVNHAATGDDDGSTWENAYVDLLDALGDLDCEEIWVAAGTYLPTVGGDSSISFVIRNGLSLYGGFNGAETQRDDRDWVNNETILSGAIDFWENSQSVVDARDTNQTTVIDGIGVSDGGRGIDARNSSLRLINLVIRDNGSGFFDSKGLLVSNGSPLIDNVIFSNNYGYVGGGTIARRQINEASPARKARIVISERMSLSTYSSRIGLK